MQNLEWYLADLKSTGKNTIETVEKSLTDMFIRLIRIYPCLICQGAYFVFYSELNRDFNKGVTLQNRGERVTTVAPSCSERSAAC